MIMKRMFEEVRRDVLQNTEKADSSDLLTVVYLLYVARRCTWEGLLVLDECRENMPEELKENIVLKKGLEYLADGRDETVMLESLTTYYWRCCAGTKNALAAVLAIRGVFAIREMMSLSEMEEVLLAYVFGADMEEYAAMRGRYWPNK